MANYNILKSAIQSVIKANGNNEITGPILQTELLSMITTLGLGYQYIGIAQPSTDPGTPDARVMYIAYTPGTYTHFGGTVVTGLCVLKYSTVWTKEDIPISGGTSFSTEPDDLTLRDSVLEFANREYLMGEQMGYVILRKDVGALQEQIQEAGIIYEIRYDFDLGNSNLYIPSGCVFIFNGGSISNGTLNGEPFRVIAKNDKKIFQNITFGSSFIENDKIFVDWFDFVTDGQTNNYNSFKRFQKLITNKGAGKIIFGENKQYAVQTPVKYQTNVYLNNDQVSVFRIDNCNNIEIDLNGSTIQVLASNTPFSNVFVFQNSNVLIHDGTIYGDRIGHDYSAYTDWSGASSTDFEWNVGIRQVGGNITIERLTIGQFTGSACVLGSDNASGSLSYHGNYKVKDCELLYCGSLGLACHSSIGICVIENCNIHHIGTFDNLPGNNPQAGIDFEYEDGIGDLPYIYINNCVFNSCTRRSISVATSSNMLGFLCENSTFKMAALSVGNLTTLSNNKIQNCYIEDSDDTEQTDIIHRFSQSMELVGCKFVNLRHIGYFPKTFDNCSFSTSSDTTKLVTNSAFALGSAIWPITKNCSFTINAGWFQMVGQDVIENTRFLFDNNINRVILVRVKLHKCSLISNVNTIERRNDNFGASGNDIVLNDCYINWPGTGNNGIGGYSSTITMHANNCYFYNSPLVLRSSYIRVTNSYLELCRISNATGGSTGETEFTNCVFYNCRGSAAKQINYINCKIENNLAEAKDRVLGLGATSEGIGLYKFIRCTLLAKNFTTNTTASYGTFENCYMDIANAYLTGAKMRNCIVHSTTDNRAAEFIDGKYYLNDVLTPAIVGASTSRPTSGIYAGFQYFDTTLGKVIVYNGTTWVNVDGSAL